MPTILELIGASKATPKTIDGISLAPTLLGKEQKARPFLYREFTGYGGQQSIRVGNWKAVRQNIIRGKGKLELYDLAKDVGEKEDIADKHPETAASLAKLMTSEHTPSKLFPLTPFDVPKKKRN